MKLEILKCHGSGNDFILIDERNLTVEFNDEQRSNMAIHWCNRDSKIGADGILFVQNSKNYDGKMIIFNSDGSEASMCGNGLRCVARYLSEDLQKFELIVDTKGGTYKTERATDFFGDPNAYSLEMNGINFDPATLPLNVNSENVIDQPLTFLDKNLKFTALSGPNPHLVAQVPTKNEPLLVTIGNLCKTEKNYLPDGTNLNFLTAMGENEVFVQTYERGVGLTNACGTGMFASTVVAAKLNAVPFSEWVTVHNPGGKVKCKVERRETGELYGYLLGNATYMYRAAVEFDLANLAAFSIIEKVMN